MAKETKASIGVCDDGSVWVSVPSYTVGHKMIFDTSDVEAHIRELRATITELREAREMRVTSIADTKVITDAQDMLSVWNGEDDE